MNVFKKILMGLGSRALKIAGVKFDSISAEWYSRYGYHDIAAILGSGGAQWAGETVTIDTALNHSVVFACNRIISENIGFIPAVLMRKETDGDLHEATGHPLYNAMKMSPNPELTAQNFMEIMTSHCVLTGNAYAQIYRRSGTGSAREMYILPPGCMDIERDNQGRLVYIIKENNAPNKTFTLKPGKPHDILHLKGLGWDGVRGYSVINMARQSIGTAIAAERNVANFWSSGGRSPYILKLLQKLKKPDLEKFREDWEATYSESNKVPILEPWLEYKDIAMSMKDAQMLESRQFSIPEICRWFSVSPHLVGDLSRATFSNIEHLFLQFVQMTLNSWINRWEQEFWRCVLTAQEKAQGYNLRFNVNELLRGDFKTRMEGYSSALQNGHMSIDEVRAMEGRNKLPNGIGAEYHIQLNMQDVDKIGEPPPAKAEPDPIKRLITRIK